MINKAHRVSEERRTQRANNNWHFTFPSSEQNTFQVYDNIPDHI